MRRVSYIREGKRWKRIGLFYTQCGQFKRDKSPNDIIPPTIMSQKINSSDEKIPKIFVFYLTQEIENMLLSKKYAWQYEMITDYIQKKTTLKTKDQSVIDYILSALNFTTKHETITDQKRDLIQDPSQMSDKELLELCNSLDKV